MTGYTLKMKIVPQPCSIRTKNLDFTFKNPKRS